MDPDPKLKLSMEIHTKYHPLIKLKGKCKDGEQGQQRGDME